MFQTTNQNVIDMGHLWEISGDFFWCSMGFYSDFTGFIWIFSDLCNGIAMGYVPPGVIKHGWLEHGP